MKNLSNKLLGTLLIIGAILFLSLAIFIRWSGYYPRAVEHVTIHSPVSTHINIEKPIKLMTWNIQFMAGSTRNHFFYVGGDDDWPTLNTIYRITKKIAAVIRKVNPDIILLQEVDIGSNRTHNIDQINLLLKHLSGHYSWVCAPYFRTKFFPHPAMPGRINSEQCIIARYKITKAARYALPSRLNVPLVIQPFLPNRTILEADLPMLNGALLHVFNVHLSAHAKGTNTLEKQTNMSYQLLSNFRWRF